jgi:hypothetical protein
MQRFRAVYTGYDSVIAVNPAVQPIAGNCLGETT